jgi:DNA modification methylase
MSKVEQCALGANARSVWRITPKPYRGAHFATFPPELVAKCLRAGSRPHDLTLDPFSGSGTTGAVAVALNRFPILIDIAAEYAALTDARIVEARANPARYAP